MGRQFKRLQYGKLAGWAGPAYEQTFRPEIIKHSFVATGIWNDALNGPDINFKPSQYSSLMEELPESMKKANYSRRRTMALAEGDKQLTSLVEEERKKIGEKNKVIAGPKFMKTAMAGKVISDFTIKKINDV